MQVQPNSWTFVQGVVANTNWRQTKFDKSTHFDTCPSILGALLKFTVFRLRWQYFFQNLLAVFLSKAPVIFFSELTGSISFKICWQYFFQSWRPISCIGASWTKECLLGPTPFCPNTSRQTYHQNNLCPLKSIQCLSKGQLVQEQHPFMKNLSKVHKEVPLFISVIRVRQVSQFTFPDKFF